ncbi:arabinofuranan 3-O-arabinosyltransferase [Nocardia tenerifensis]|uniref:Arabinofuranan 3-O-arabinosyltransferase n=1 Tax=Nocardia tenerifensis TaxID=228006 RepID=A0A318JLG7_9NOCA|nr:glycosyltransferase family 87 protein [Nocardia tenerifensis]PXX54103.1 arabinofuranan 3-O-arabinosyltransferase [Nocardia tenerifensis]
MLLRQLEPRSARTTAEVIKFALWPIAVMTVLNRVFIKAVNGFITDDFRPVYQASLDFLNGRPVYTANFDSVDPHYLYYPSGTLLIAPVAWIHDYEKARWLFILLNAVAIIVAWYLLLRLFRFTLSSVVAPVLLFAMFMSETVTNTLVFTNVNGCVLLAEMLFLHLLLQRKDLWAGVALGLSIAIKPTLAPLLLVALVRGQWKVFITALGVPVVLTAIAWPLSKDPEKFFSHTAPYLFETRDYFNSAISGNGEYYGLPPWLIWFMRLGMGVLVAVSLWLLWRYYRHDELFFVCTASGVLLTAEFLLSSLGQMYYSMMLFPFLMTVVLRNSVLRNWPAWLAIFGFMSYDKWLSERPGWQHFGRDLEYLRITFGWGLLLVVVFCVLGDRYLAAKREGRLQFGIDPTWIKPVPGDVAADSSRSAEGSAPIVAKPISVE